MATTNGYIGVPSIQTSVASAECLPSPPANFTMSYYFQKLSFKNLADCHISINGGSYCYFAAKDGINIDLGDVPIYSIKIQESGIQYYYFGEF